MQVNSQEQIPSPKESMDIVSVPLIEHRLLRELMGTMGNWLAEGLPAEAVTNTRFGQNVTGSIRFRLDLAAEVCNVNVEVMRIGTVLCVPDLAQERLLSEYLAGVAHQSLEELIFQRSEVQLLTT